MHKNIIIRKASLYLNSLPRLINRYFNDNKEKFILINSFPKSGTHLLYQVFSNQNFVKDYRVFIASMPSLYKKPRSESEMLKIIGGITSNELVRSHIYYSKDIDVMLSQNCIHYFIYRDPRDVVISEANYLYNMNKWHKLHKYFRKYNNLEDRIKFSILGNDFHQTNILYDNINKRYLDYLGWINNPNVFSVKYEELISSQKENIIQDIIRYYSLNTNKLLNIDEIFLRSMDSIDPSKSHTFNTGGAGKWKKYFTNEHKELFKEYAGDLLIKLGYENDFSW